MADSPKRPNDAAWDDLDQAFFASAPPDVPELPAEPERFDDLFPAEPPEHLRKREVPVALQRAAAVATSTRASLQRAWVDVRRRTGPAIASAGRQTARLTSSAWRRSTRALGSAGLATLRTVRPAAARIVTTLRGRRPSGRAIAIALASVVLVTGLSAVVVASRNSAPARLPATPLVSRASAAGTTIASAAPAPAPALPFPPDPEPPAPTDPEPPAPTVQSSPPDPEPPTAQPSLPDPEPRPRLHSSQANDGRRRHAEPAKRPAAPTAAAPAAPAPAHKHRRAGAYSAEKDLMVPSFMQQGPQPASPATRQPAPAPAQRPLFSR